MKSPKMTLSTLFLSILLCFAGSGLAHAEEEVEDADAEVTENEAPVEYGVAVRGLAQITPKFMLELFWDEVPSGGLNPGFAVDFLRRRGNFEIAAGLGYGTLSTDDGLYLEKGDEPPGETPDFTEFDGFGWVTLEVNFMWTKALHEMFALRYGAGIGLGIMLGDILQTDTTCTGTQTSSCTPVTQGGGGVQFQEPADTPPVFALVNVIGGVQIKPIPKLTINIDAGIRTSFFAGMSVGYYF